MGIEEVADIIERIADGFEEECLKCLDANSGRVLGILKAQMFSGVDGEEKYLSPTYDADPFFNEPGPWFGRSKDYKAWKMEITPPVADSLLGLPGRPDNVPNLYINGKFYSEITAVRAGDALVLDPGQEDGPDIVRKYGEAILKMGPTGVGYFNTVCLLPAIDSFFKDCGYRK